MRKPQPKPKPLEWVGDSLERVRGFPPAVRQIIGQSLYAAQLGTTGYDTKPLRGFKGAGIVEAVADHDKDTFRAVYTVRFARVVYVLHAFQKKAKKGIKTPKKEIDLVKQRLRDAEAHWREHYPAGGTG